MHAAAINLRGGVSPRNTRFRGQSIIEYVLIIAVIGLAIVFAGPGVAGAIRNQFNLVTNALDSATSGDSFISAEEKAHQEAVKSIAAKEAKDWTLAELKTVSMDISKKGTSSVAYAKAKAAMDARTEWKIWTRGGWASGYIHIIGINHDDLADGSGKAGLTFLCYGVVNRTAGMMNSNPTNSGGWEKSDLRKMINSSEYLNKFDDSFTSLIVPVRKVSNNIGGGRASKNVECTTTIDKLFVLSYSEIVPTSYWADEFPWTSSEGSQYEAFKGKVTNNHGVNSSLSRGSNVWLRTCSVDNGGLFLMLDGDGNPTHVQTPTSTEGFHFAFCF